MSTASSVVCTMYLDRQLMNHKLQFQKLVTSVCCGKAGATEEILVP